jgi:hypothetical protein
MEAYGWRADEMKDVQDGNSREKHSAFSGESRERFKGTGARWIHSQHGRKIRGKEWYIAKQRSGLMNGRGRVISM